MKNRGYEPSRQAELRRRLMDEIRTPGPRSGPTTGRFDVTRDEAESYADSLGLQRGTPAWGGAIRDFVLNGPPRFADQAAHARQFPQPGVGPKIPTTFSTQPAGDLTNVSDGIGHNIDVGDVWDDGDQSSGGFPTPRPSGQRLLLAAAQERRLTRESGRQARAMPPLLQQSPSRAPRDALKSQIALVESNHGDRARNPNSSATGRYQMTDETWMAYYRKAYGDTGETAAQIRAKRLDGRVQEPVMDALISDNEKELTAAGHEVTPTTLYLAHFAGYPTAIKILDRPGESALSLFGKKAVDANPFLRRMTGADVIKWAERKMNRPAR